MNLFQKLATIINSHSSNGVENVPIEDAVLTSSSEIDYDEVLKHYKKYTSLLTMYVNNTRVNLYAKILFKVVFFAVTIWIWIVLVKLFCVSFDIAFDIISNTENSANYMETAVNLMIALIPSLISLITSFIVIPQVIAKYLFYRKEEGNMIEIIKSLQSYDDVLYKHRYNKEVLANKAYRDFVDIVEKNNSISITNEETEELIDDVDEELETKSDSEQCANIEQEG